MALLAEGPHVDAVIARLATITIDGTPVPVEDTTVRAATTPPYLVVQPVPGGGLDGPMGAPNDDGDLVVLVKAVAARTGDGQGRNLCQALQHEARKVLLGRQVTVAGRSVHISLDVRGGVDVDPDPNPDRFFAVDRLIVTTTA